MTRFSSAQEEHDMQIKTIINNFSEVFERLGVIERAVSNIEGRCGAMHGEKN
jgi:prolyl-tRNA synthetase